MKLLMIILSSIILTGCFETTPVQQEHVVVRQLEYVVKIPPKELITLPAPVEKINVDTAKQSDVATWVLANEERTRTLENMLKGIAQFFVVEQAKAKDEADTKNAFAKIEAVNDEADFADKVIKTPVKK